MALEIDTEIFKRQAEVLQAAASLDSELGKRLRQCIFDELKATRNRIMAGINFKNGDPRGTARAVKRYVAKKYLGGVVSILDSRDRSGGSNSYEAPRKTYPGPGGKRGGNRMLRSTRTDDILHLAPADRGFILRFVNSGTNPRYANGRNGKWGNTGNATFGRLQEDGDYYRGQIAPRNFFGTDGERQMQQAVQNLAQVIDEEFNKLFE
jgi:hypothetical protein